MRLHKKTPKPGSDVGRPVFTSDDEHIGDVKKVEDGGILIDVSMGKDFWLSERDVQSRSGDRLVLTFGADELDEYKREERPPKDVPQGIPRTQAGLISDDEQMQMRERLERDLMEQRRERNQQ